MVPGLGDVGWEEEESLFSKESSFSKIRSTYETLVRKVFDPAVNVHCPVPSTAKSQSAEKVTDSSSEAASSESSCKVIGVGDGVSSEKSDHIVP